LCVFRPPPPPHHIKLISNINSSHSERSEETKKIDGNIGDKNYNSESSVTLLLVKKNVLIYR
jgi:hypothetical protein